MLPPISRVGIQGTPPPSPLDFDYIKQWQNTLLSWSVGAVTFPACLGLFQALVFRPLTITSATFGAHVFGFGSVATAGVMASVGLMGTSAYFLNFGAGKFLVTYIKRKAGTQGRGVEGYSRFGLDSGALPEPQNPSIKVRSPGLEVTHL